MKYAVVTCFPDSWWNDVAGACVGSMLRSWPKDMPKFFVLDDPALAATQNYYK